jgi:ubiquinone/menaquinone biosynthesis C-methylase UbiE
MFDAYLEFKGDLANDSILEVCAAPLNRTMNLNNSCHHSNETTLYEIELSSNEVVPHPSNERSIRFESTGGRKLPFSDGQFDWVYCNALIEHAGSRKCQYELLKELTRAARKGIFVTAGNRWHPIEFNTGLPLIHWLPLAMWRRLLKILGKRRWAAESVLNPLGSKQLGELADLLPGKLKSDIGHIRFFFIKAHFFLMIEKCDH